MTKDNVINFETIRITNDFMFCSVLEDEAICKEFLERILGIEIAELSIIQKQRSEKNHFLYKGIRLDVYVKDVHGNVYDIEMQTTKEKYLAKRCRYYHSEMDGYQIREGIGYNGLKKSIVIFICTYDPFGYNLSLYSFSNKCEEVDELSLDDGISTIIVNTMGNRDGLDGKLVALLEYINSGTIADEYTLGIQHAVDRLKYDDDWRDRYMTLEMKMNEKYDQGVEDGKEIGKEMGVKLGKEMGVKLGKEMGVKVGKEMGVKLGKEMGVKLGQEMGNLQTLVSLVVKKMRKQKSLDAICSELELDPSEVKPIYDIALKYAPDYNESDIVDEIVAMKK